MSQSKDTHKKHKQHRKKKSPLLKLLLGLGLCFLLFIACVLVYIMSAGSGVPASGSGIIATQLPAMDPAPTESTEPPEEPSTTEPTEETESTQPESTEPEPTEPEPELHVQKAMKLMEEMTLEEKLWQMIFLTPDELTDTTAPTVALEGTGEALQTYPVGGLVYFGEHILSADQISQMIGNTQGYAKIPLLIAVDEEGGSVSRLSRSGITDSVQSMASYGAAGDEQAVYDLGQHFAEKLTSVGFNVDFAPVADIVTNPYNTEIGSRAFSDDPEIAAKMVAKMVQGLQDGGTISCLKHFPGHGSTSADSHYGLSVSDRSLEELRESEFIPFRAGIDAGVEMVMISHMSLPEVTGNDQPCDFSYKVVTELLRQELGFEGVIVTDSHTMGSIFYYYDCGEAALLAVQAGCDIVVMPESKTDAFQALSEAVANGTLSEERINESVLRILSLKFKYGIIPE